jgi:hypothetical protein
MHLCYASCCMGALQVFECLPVLGARSTRGLMHNGTWRPMHSCTLMQDLSKISASRNGVCFSVDATVEHTRAR